MNSSEPAPRSNTCTDAGCSSATRCSPGTNTSGSRRARPGRPRPLDQGEADTIDPVWLQEFVSMAYEPSRAPQKYARIAAGR